MYDFIAELDKVLNGTSIKSKQIVEASRKFRQAKIIAESREPQGGAFWFLPQEDGGWYLQSFYESMYKNTDHSYIWARYVCKLLFPKPSSNVRLAYAGLPRGRVVLLKSGPIIYHGNDLPNGNASIKEIAREFNLPRGKYRVIYEEHEQMIPEHYFTIKNALKYKYKLTEPKRINFDDYADYDYDEAI